MSRWSWWWLGCLALAAIGGCGDDVPTRDAGSDAGGPVDGGVVVAPDIPWLAEGVPPIQLAPCPAGWREVPGAAVTECDPYPEEGPESCEAGEAHFPGEPGCRPIGDVCPAGDYATSLPMTGTVVYVEASAIAGGDGTLTAPFANLSEVPWPSLPAGATVALGKGTFPGTLPLRPGVHVVGACVQETVVTGLSAPVPSVVTVTSAGAPAVVRNVTIRDAPQGGALVRDGGRLSLRGVLIEGGLGVGARAEGAGTEMNLTDVVLRDTEASGLPSVEAGLGLLLRSGALFDGARLIVARNHSVGVAVLGEGTVATLADSVVRGTRPRGVDGVIGHGIDVQGSGRLHATRLLVSDNHDAGLFVTGEGSTVSLTDSVVRGTAPQVADGTGGHGIRAGLEAHVTATRVLVSDNYQVGVALGGATVVLEDVVVSSENTIGSSGSDSRLITIQVGGRLEGTRLLFTGSAELGAFVGGAASSMRLTDAAFHYSESTDVAGEFGRGISVQDGAHFTASRMLIANHRDIALFGSDAGSVMELSDVVIRDTRPRASDRRFGRALEGQGGVRIEGMRLAIERHVDAGVVAHLGATVALSDVSVRGVDAAECGSTPCGGGAHGHGVAAFSASVFMSRFWVADVATCGVMVAPIEFDAEAGSLDLELGVVSDSEIGACVQVSGYDFGRLMNGVQYRDNGTNLDSTSLPIPALADGTGF